MTRSASDGDRIADRASARDFVDKFVMPAAAEFDRDQAIPRTFLTHLGQTGVLGAVLSEEYGGLGLNMVTLGAIHEEFGRGCSSLRSLLTVQTMVAHSIARWGTDEQRQRWLPSLATGEMLAAFCLSERNAGSSTNEIATTASTDGEGWILRGSKTWITGGQIADVYLVLARSDTTIAGFLVPSDAEGLKVVPISDLLGTRASMLAEVILDGVRVPAGAHVGPRAFAPGFLLTAALDIGRYSVACGSVGIIQACLEASLAYAQDRRVGGALLSEYQLTQAKLADMLTAVTAARVLCERAGKLKDDGDASTVMTTWIAKYFASSAAAKAAAAAVQLYGANGCTNQYPVARLYRDAKIMEIIEGSSEVQQITIAEWALRQTA
jgi:alkylation response protein AidB-like acyl-CoA dehydrogenase